MTPKEKAIELAEKYNHLIHDGWEYAAPSDMAKAAVILCCEEIIEALSYSNYWDTVKEEIEKL